MYVFAEILHYLSVWLLQSWESKYNACFIIFSAANKNDWWPCSTFMILSLKCFQNKSNIKFIKLEQKVHMRFLITYLFLKKRRRTMDLEHSLRPKMIHCGEMTKKHCVHFFEFPTSLRPRCIQPIHHNWAKIFLKSYLYFFFYMQLNCFWHFSIASRGILDRW